jgi:hypothetical protein
MKANTLPGIFVELRANGQALPEYQDEETTNGGSTTATRYVEATSNTEFSVHLLIQPDFPYMDNELLVRIKVDGQRLRGIGDILTAKTLRRGGKSFSESVITVKGESRRRLFTFGELKTSEHLGVPRFGDTRTNVVQRMSLFRVSRALG